LVIGRWRGPRGVFRLVADWPFAYTDKPQRNHLLIDVCECCRTDPMTA
jgi:hypothetical protein